MKNSKTKQGLLIFALAGLLTTPAILTSRNINSEIISYEEETIINETPKFTFNESSIDIGGGMDSGTITYKDVKYLEDEETYKTAPTLELKYSSNIIPDGVELTIEDDSVGSSALPEFSHSIIPLPNDLTEIEQMNYLYSQWAAHDDYGHEIDLNGNISLGETAIFSNLFPGDELKLGIVRTNAYDKTGISLAEPLILNVKYNSDPVPKTKNFIADDIKDDLFWDVKNHIYSLKYKKKEIKETSLINEEDINYGNQTNEWKKLGRKYPWDENFLISHYNKTIGGIEYTFSKTFTAISEVFDLDKNVISNVETLSKGTATDFLRFYGSDMPSTYASDKTWIWLKLEGDPSVLSTKEAIEKEVDKQQAFINNAIDFGAINNIPGVSLIDENSVLSIGNMESYYGDLRTVDSENNVYVPAEIYVNSDSYKIDSSLDWSEAETIAKKTNVKIIDIFNEFDQEQELEQILNNFLFAIRRNAEFDYTGSKNSINLHAQESVRAIANGKLKENFFSNSETISIVSMLLAILVLILVIIYFIAKGIKEKINVKIVRGDE